MTKPTEITPQYRYAMGRLLVLYTQVDRLIMEICAERLSRAPDEAAALSLAKQVGDESRHVAIQREWMSRFGVDSAPIIAAGVEDRIRVHFRALPWLDFLADLYICVEALGSHAVEEIVPLADPGTRESLRVPLEDELDHVAFGLGRLCEELARLPATEREAFLARLPSRIEAVATAFKGFGLPLAELFGAVGADYSELCARLDQRRAEILADLSTSARAAA